MVEIILACVILFFNYFLLFFDKYVDWAYRQTSSIYLKINAFINKIYLQFLDRLTFPFVVCLYGS